MGANFGLSGGDPNKLSQQRRHRTTQGWGPFCGAMLLDQDIREPRAARGRRWLRVCASVDPSAGLPRSPATIRQLKVAAFDVTNEVKTWGGEGAKAGTTLPRSKAEGMQRVGKPSAARPRRALWWQQQDLAVPRGPRLPCAPPRACTRPHAFNRSLKAVRENHEREHTSSTVGTRSWVVPVLYQ